MKHGLTPLAGAAVAALLVVATLHAQEDAREVNLEIRYGVPVDGAEYPQGDPKETIRSVIKAMRTGDIPYMLAQLISPAQVDQKFQGDREALLRLGAKATPEKTRQTIRALEEQLQHGSWTIEQDLAWSHVEKRPVLSLEQIGRRWFMHNTPIERPASP